MVAVATRVAFDVGPLYGHRTGIGSAVAAMLDEFERRRTVGSDGIELVPYLLSARARREQRSRGLRRPPLPASLAHRLWAVGDRPRLDRWFGDVGAVHGTNYVVPPTRTPRLVSVYDCWFLANPSLANDAVRRAGTVLARRVGEGAHVHTSSAASAAAVRSLLGAEPGQVTTIHLGPLPGLAPPQQAPISGLPQRPYALAVGTKERRKNLPRLVAAFDRASASTDLALVIAGAPGDDDVALRTAFETMSPGARRRCWLLGAVDEQTKAWLVGYAHLIAYPSLDEGFGFPVLEAQRAGVPIVAARAGSIPEIGGDGVEYVDPLDVDGIADALVRVAGDDALRARLVEAGTANVARFSWERTVDELTTLYRRVACAR